MSHATSRVRGAALAVGAGVARVCGQALYAILSAAPRRHKVAFLSRQNDGPSRDFRLLAEELRRRDPGLEIVMRCKLMPSGIGGRIAYLGEVLAQMYELATSRVCIVDGYVIPVSMLNHGSSLTVVQMWHALGALKKFGMQSVGRPGGRPADLSRHFRMHRNYDFVLCGGPASVDTFAEAFGVELDSVVPVGLPRVDYLLEHRDDTQYSAAIEELMRRHPRLSDRSRTRVLYAPTFRKNSATSFAEVVGALADDRLTLIVKPHDLEALDAHADHVVDATGVDALDLLLLADVVITDYSAIALEAAVIEKPVFFFVYDLEQYRVEHGLNVDPSVEMPGVTATHIGPIVEAIVEGDYALDSIRELRSRYVSVPEGGCTAAIAELVLGRL